MGAKVKMILVAVRLPEELVRLAKHYAVDQHTTFQEVVGLALQRHLGLIGFHVGRPVDPRGPKGKEA